MQISDQKCVIRYTKQNQQQLFQLTDSNKVWWMVDSVAGSEKQKQRSRKDVDLSVHLQLNMTTFALSARRMTSARAEHISRRMRFINLQNHTSKWARRNKAEANYSARAEPSPWMSSSRTLLPLWQTQVTSWHTDIVATSAASAVQNSGLRNVLKHHVNRINAKMCWQFIISCLLFLNSLKGEFKL